jgi:hypothetical protein
MSISGFISDSGLLHSKFPKLHNLKSMKRAAEKAFNRTVGASDAVTLQQLPELLKNFFVFARVMEFMEAGGKSGESEGILEQQQFSDMLKLLKPGFDNYTEQEAGQAFVNCQKFCESKGGKAVEFDDFCEWASQFLLPDLIKGVEQ